MILKHPVAFIFYKLLAYPCDVEYFAVDGDADVAVAGLAGAVIHFQLSQRHVLVARYHFVVNIEVTISIRLWLL